MQAANSGVKLLRALALCGVALCFAAAVYMSAAEHYDDALKRMQSSSGMFIVFIVVSIGVTLALASFVSNLLVGNSSRDERVRLAMKLKEYVTNITKFSFCFERFRNRYTLKYHDAFVADTWSHTSRWLHS